MELGFTINDPQGAVRYFENKTRYSTGPMEVDYALTHGRKIGVDFNIIDVRRPADYAKGHIPGSTNLSEDRWSSFQGLARDRLNLIYCYSGVCHLAARASVEFAKAGYSVMEIDGGFEAWEAHDLTTEASAPEPASGGRPGLASPFQREHEDTRFESLL